MTYFSHIRAGLISTALLLTTALASPALAETLPEISPRQIASDVEIKYNPETGAKEYIAPSFDPFEEDRTMAGTASLRSVSNATTIDGQSVRGGALLDMTFYYNSASNDPYDTRGFDDAVYLSGEYAPVLRRDNRILECNEKVQDVVYYHEDYYRPSLYVNLFRPYRHYRGHHRYYDRGYGHGYGYGRGYRGHRGYRGGRAYRRGYDGYGRRGHRTRDRRGFADRAIDRAREENGLPRRPRGERADRDARRDRGERGTREGNRAERRANRANRNRENRIDTRHSGRGITRRMETIPRTERIAPPRAERAPRSDRAPRAERAPRTPRSDFAGAAPRVASPRVTPRTSTPRPAPAPRAVAPAPRVERAAPASRPQRTQRSGSSFADRAVNRARKIKSNNAPRRNLGRKGRSKLKMMGFLPMASAWSRNVVRNVDVQCAREEMLTVHIPQDRLDAARFDGLTVLVLDRAGQEVPVYVPANYIEGYRQAVSGQVTPSGSYQDSGTSAPITRAPAYQDPRPYSVESAPCPVGTTKQEDGTCLQGGTETYSGYPTR